MRLSELDWAQMNRRRNQKKRESYFEYHMALVKTAPYTLTSLIVASVWSIIYEEPFAYVPFAIFVIIAILTVYSRMRASALASQISNLSILIGQIESRISLREGYVKNGFQDALDRIYNYYDRSWETVRFEDWMTATSYQQNWKNDLPEMILLDMRYRHPELFELMEALDNKTAKFGEAANAFREKAKSLIDEPILMSGVRDDQRPDWISKHTRGLILALARDIVSPIDVRNKRKLGALTAGEEQALALIFPEDKPHLLKRALKNTDLVNLARDAEEKRADAERTYLEIRQRIGGLYRRPSLERRV